MQPRWQQTRRVYLQYTLRKKEGTNNLTHQGKGPEDQIPQNCTSIDPAGAAIACYSRQRCRGGGVKVPVRTDSMVDPSYTVGRHADLDDDRCAHSNGAELLVKGDAGAQRLAVERDQTPPHSEATATLGLRVLCDLHHCVLAVDGEPKPERGAHHLHGDGLLWLLLPCGRGHQIRGAALLKALLGVSRAHPPHWRHAGKSGFGAPTARTRRIKVGH
mmetsp:Transcript_68149/g.164770  ORF Transcript_68149/g.164770 Transcript_68149/m.164770 type:complete len:216 (-) Transcript_68149:778-1425(-)